MQFGTKVPGTPFGTPGCRRDVSFPPTHETAPLFLYKHVILATHSLCILQLNSHWITLGIVDIQTPLARLPQQLCCCTIFQNLRGLATELGGSDSHVF